MANAIAISLIKISMPDSTNIHTAAFITTIYLNKLNNTYYPIWKSIIKFYLMGQNLWNILEELEMVPIDTLNNEVERKKQNLKAKKVMWIFQDAINKENYLHIQDIKEPKKVLGFFENPKKKKKK